ncbi:hypothetical protein [Flavobacterium sp.]|uniref:hypothetical protein n=1 Tax=Flavobacterium sp. TaxID=239 RepID=UPI0026190670|nr:hypothetical protein [Flavobacterium sp.]
MKFKLSILFILIFVLFSCKNEDQNRIAETQKDINKKEIIFSNIEKGWIFNANPINATSKANALTWSEWGLFLTELNQKPKKTIGAFQKKSTELSKKAIDLNNNIPLDFNKPQIKSRISTLITKVKMLDLFIHLDNIPDKKVIVLVGEINEELVSLQKQMEKLVQKSKIPMEAGESDLIKMLDTTRAIPTRSIPTTRQQFEVLNMPRVE